MSGCRCFGRALYFGSRFVLAPRWPPAPFLFGHPGRWPSAALSAASSQPFQAQDRFFNLFAFLTQLGQHFCNIHCSLFSPNLYFLAAPVLGGGQEGTPCEYVLLEVSLISLFIASFLWVGRR